MKPMVVVMRRSAISLGVVAVVAVGGIIGLSKMGVNLLPPESMRKLNVAVDKVVAKSKEARTFVVDKFESFSTSGEETTEEHAVIVVTSPKVQDITITESFVCQIRSKRHIEVRALEGGYLNKIWIQEGQAVKEGDYMFQVLPVLYKARLDAEVAEVELARLKWEQAKSLLGQKFVSDQDVKLHEAELAKADAKRQLAKAELSFTDVKASFSGIVDRLLQREGSLIREGDILTTLADNSVMWVYFNVPEKYYLEYMARRKQHQLEDKIELVLANGDTFPQKGVIGAIEAEFNNENGNIKFRADFPNPEALLRNGQTGTIKINRPFRNALLIPQRATFEILDKRYVWVIDAKGIAHQTLITITHELEDIFVIDKGLKAEDKIVLEGVREVQEGGKVEYEFRKPEDAISNQKYRAE
ncbi:efflux RND transporter periplasmic adaptor subunit [Singulisphaera rosea]